MPNSRKQLLIYLGFAVWVLICAAFAKFDPHLRFAHPSQRSALQFISVIPILALGILGSWLWGRVRFNDSEQMEKRKILLVVQDVLIGTAFGAMAVLLDRYFLFSQIVAAKLGIATIHVPFPDSLIGYSAGAIMLESMYRIIPIPIVLWIVSRVSKSERVRVMAFWIIAFLVALLEPVSQTMFLSDHRKTAIGMGLFIFLFNLFQARQLKQHGVASPITTRLAFYLVWHVAVGPFVVEPLQ